VAAEVYDLVVAKGPENRRVRRRLVVEERKSTAIKVKLVRWANLAKAGWYSGDDGEVCPECMTSTMRGQ